MTDDVPRAAKPLVWLFAALWFPIRAAGRLLIRFLAAYVRGVEAAERKLRRFWSALMRTIARFCRPFAGLLRWIGARLHTAWLWMAVRVFTPVGRWLASAGRAVARIAAPPVRAADRGVRRLARRLAPFVRAVLNQLDATGAAIARVLRPIRDASRDLARAVRMRLPR